MYDNVSDEINRKAIEEAEPYKPQLKWAFDSGKSFMELYSKEGATFCQVLLTDKSADRKREKIEFNAHITYKEDIERLIKKYNEVLKDKQQEIAEQLLGSYERENYLYFNRVGQDIGFCHCYVFERNEQKEEEEEERRDRERQLAGEPDVHCTACGDGGCPHCKPHLFI